ncbi:DUF4880 domain-containing protein [Pigmentiphaga aceris]|uniref:DUF4880 domain-containing protein n=1 Tax=Pigmentiphaga aceris TaxID=1940612 RepID=A0A5C0AZK4_9BURK|nr:FecR domain-containing protein [Pigmentiphaga aceris]QEI07126.1 DUF4880 domain-containing protein [Pigmentiphaga aceris]
MTSVTTSIAPEVLDAAIMWMVRAQSGFADRDTLESCRRWRAAHPAHEAAWLQLQAAEAPLQALHTLPHDTRHLARDTLHAARAAAAPVDRSKRRSAKLLAWTLMGGGSLLLTRQLPWQRWRADYATGTGEQRSVTLSDGTQLRLNTRSAVDVVYSATQRLIVLRQGEIFVVSAQAAHGSNPAANPDPRPLRVQTGHARLQALGTRFGVRLDDDHTRLRMEEGAVAMHPGAQMDAPDNIEPAAVAHAGDAFRIDTRQVQRLPDTALDGLSWTRQVLVVKQIRLDALLAELSRYRDGWLDCDADVASWQVSGVLQLRGDSPTDAVLRALTHSLPVQLRQVTPYWVTVGRA